MALQLDLLQGHRHGSTVLCSHNSAAVLDSISWNEVCNCCMLTHCRLQGVSLHIFLDLKLCFFSKVPALPPQTSSQAAPGSLQIQPPAGTSMV